MPPHPRGQGLFLLISVHITTHIAQGVEEKKCFLIPYTSCVWMARLLFLQQSIKGMVLTPNTGTMGQSAKLGPSQDTRKTIGYPISGQFCKELAKLKIWVAVYVWSGRGREMPKARVSKGPDPGENLTWKMSSVSLPGKAPLCGNQGRKGSQQCQLSVPGATSVLALGVTAGWVDG